MSDCVKLDVLDAFATVVESVSRIKKVLVSPATPIELDALTFPAAFVYDEPETVEPRNRLEVGRFRLHIEIWREGYNFAREAENDRAYIKKAIYESMGEGLLRALKVTTREVEADKFYQEIDASADGSPIVGMGGIVVVYDVAYLTKYRDPFTQADY